MPTIKDIFNDFVNKVEPEIKQVVGSFAPSVGHEINDNGFTIYASPYIRVLIDGRRPTSANATAGSPTLREAILDWINRHNITPNDPRTSKQSLAYLISRSIHEKGTLLYQRIQAGGEPNRIFDPIFTDARVDELLRQVSEVMYRKVQELTVIK